jgi:hypothetical protein
MCSDLRETFLAGVADVLPVISVDVTVTQQDAGTTERLDADDATRDCLAVMQLLQVPINSTA